MSLRPGPSVFVGCALSPKCSLGTRRQIDRTSNLAAAELEVRLMAAVTGCDSATQGSF